MRLPRGVLQAVSVLVCLCAGAVGHADPLAFEVTFDKALRAEPFTGRVLIFLAEKRKADAGPFGGFGRGSGEPRTRYSWFSRDPLFSTDVHEWQPDTPLVVDHPNGFPCSIGELPKAKYEIQAVMHTNPDVPHSGTAPGNLYSAVKTKELDPTSSGVIRIRIDRRVEKAATSPELDRAEVVEVRSPLLSKFHDRDIFHRAVVRLPKEYDDDPERRFPTLYIIPGFGSDHLETLRMYSFLLGKFSTPFVLVALDPSTPHGHHVFADSDNCGPRGQALVEEFIPYLEKRFRLIAKPRGRLLTGHSSGGWSSLWLQVTYPDFFGGTWSTSPDSVDFHDFCGIDLYGEKTNIYTDADGERRPIMRNGGRVMLYLEDFVRMEDTLGPGGQIHSFESVFGPRGADGQPKPMFDRRTGKIDPTVVEAWRRYDIVGKIEREWDTLGARLSGKFTVIMGEEDNFYLNGATRRLKAALERLGSDARVILVPGKDHSSVIFSKPFRAMAGEMSERVGVLERTGGEKQSEGPTRGKSDARSQLMPTGQSRPLFAFRVI